MFPKKFDGHFFIETHSGILYIYVITPKEIPSKFPKKIHGRFHDIKPWWIAEEIPKSASGGISEDISGWVFDSMPCGIPRDVNPVNTLTLILERILFFEWILENWWNIFRKKHCRNSWRNSQSNPTIINPISAHKPSESVLKISFPIFRSLTWKYGIWKNVRLDQFYRKVIEKPLNFQYLR